MSIKLDLHLHSESRGKIFIEADDLRYALGKNNLDGAAITNFFSLSHAVKIKEEIKDFIIIIGQEICSQEGHLTALGLKEKIADLQPAHETINQIHSQGGIAVAVHPFLPLGLGKKVTELSVDAIEVYNAALGASIIYNYRAKRVSEKLGIPGLSSTDTTAAEFVGRSYTEVMTDDKAGILNTICTGDVKLVRKALPFPFLFTLKSILRFKNLAPCSTHAVPCLICGYSMVVRLFKEKVRCLDCGKVELSRILCCNGHYICDKCVAKRYD
ncbi:MAG: PHP-associated domain-containing protein [Candidatus Saelkia tenebricola]|nr:PHP-associated domain-containing protein [Candidatus Saelkia tenebricola]